MWPHTAPRLSQFGWWVLASILVIVAAQFVEPVRRVRVFGGLLVGCVAIFAAHVRSVGGALAWCYQSTFILTAAWLIAERVGWPILRRALLVVAWAQLPLMALQAVGVTLPWPAVITHPITGALGSRAPLASLLAVASMLSPRRPALILALAACLTGSLMGWPALIRLWWQSPCKPWPSLWGWPVLAALTHRWWWPKLAIRMESWSSLSFLKGGWLTGWGFLPFPGGFWDDSTPGRMFLWRDYHSMWMDWIARTGLIGGLVAVGLIWWIIRRLRVQPSWGWTMAMLFWIGAWQSAEAFPVLALLGVMGVIGLVTDKEKTCHISDTAIGTPTA